MSKNLISEIVKLLGVEMEEAFKLRRPDYEVCENGIYAFFENEGLMKKNKQGEFDSNSSIEFEDLCLGNYEIVKLPWEPKRGESYYAMSIVGCAQPKIACYDWNGSAADYACLKEGLVHKTQAEAEEHFAEDYQRLTGKELKG